MLVRRAKRPQILGHVTRDQGPSRDRHDSIQRISDLLAQGASSDALVVARNAIAGGAGYVRGFGNAVASVYRALQCPDYAEVAVHSYEPSDADLERQAQIDALMSKATRSSS